MSKLKIGDKVFVQGVNDNMPKCGIIKGREVIELPDNKVRIEYVVKTGDGFDKWGVYSKKEITKVNKTPKRKTPTTLVVDAPNGYKVTLVALVEKHTILKDVFVNDEGFFNQLVERKGRKLSIGYSIYNPNDTYDPELGTRIALHRAKKTPFCYITSEFGGEFNKETVEALLKVKGEYIAKNIEDFISK